MAIELYGLARIKAINSPKYFNDIRTELFNSFKDDSAEEFTKEILQRIVDQNYQEKFNIPNSLVNKTTEVFKKIFLTSGIMGNLFLEACVKIEGVNSHFNKIRDTIAEIIIKDGIVTKIDIIKYPEN
ncbi:MAG: hypothetical protein KatS3mg068_0022 [Candidatus Sericytochromatia bacterium]|nr:MAG: hypothetical protein KatS3mg068_0022 [Candidatus Sericytochromatia bacterium]